MWTNAGLATPQNLLDFPPNPVDGSFAYEDDGKDAPDAPAGHTAHQVKGDINIKQDPNVTL